ncbi:MAG: thioredoxin domain-containing protein [Deltaproteobacteria bacterium]|nr:thioredoxin domain-containing protein [Deltaproteobacteria bacterium]MBW2192858.1 thioredoxin domain-containing protein [Deltaproteobacteria bacterium]
MPLLEQVLEKYPRDVKLVFKNFPLRNHKFARPAAIAALAAGKQGRFWEFHDLLFKNYSRLNAQKINEIARQLDLNMVQFEKDQKDPRIRDQVTRDLSDGAKVSVRGTPTVFINGRLLRSRKLTGFQGLIEKALERQP